MRTMVAMIALCLGITGTAFAESKGAPSAPTPAAISADLASPVIGRAIARAFSDQSAASAEWQREYDSAIGRKNSAKKKMLIGTAAVVAGTVIMVTGGSSCDLEDALDDFCEDETDMVWLGWLGSTAGSGLLLWGGIQYWDASGDLSRLMTQRPQQRSAINIPISEHLKLGVSAGQRNVMSIGASW